jgi:hypothetical protein
MQSKGKSFLASWLKRDGLAMLLFVLVAIVMTYPLIRNLGGDWVTTKIRLGVDVFMKLWDIWWLGQIASGDQSPFFTSYLFYPPGLDMSFHTISWTSSALAWLFVPLTGSLLTSYKLTILVGIFAAAYGAYLLILELTHKRAAAWLGGSIYSFAPYHIAHSDSHPDLTHVVFIPIAALFLIRAIRDRSLKAAIGAGLTVGLAAFTSYYILDFAFLTLIPLAIFLALEQKRWRQPSFWRIAGVFGGVTLIIVGLRFLPFIMNIDDLGSTLEWPCCYEKEQADLLALVLPSSSHDAFRPMLEEFSLRFPKSRRLPPYLGIVPVALTISALTWKSKRKQIWFWFALGVFFLLLTLGPVLRFNGVLYENVPMLWNYVDRLPPIGPVRPNFFHQAVLLPLAICAAFGLERWLRAAEHKRHLQLLLVVPLSLLLIFEYWNGQFPMSEIPVNPIYEQIGEQDGEFAIIELPIGRYESKLYLYNQTVHGKPMVEGAAARTPEYMYWYIGQNKLLVQWRLREVADCEGVRLDEWQAAVDQLVADGFRYVLVHSDPPEEPYASYFEIEPIYAGDGITAYDLVEMQAFPPCSGSESASLSSPAAQKSEVFLQIKALAFPI